MSEIAVIGAGAWGTGIAIVLGRKGTHHVRLWAHETDVCESITQHRVNEKFLPGRQIPDSVTASNDLAAALKDAQIIVSVMPSQHCRALFERMRPTDPPQTLIVSATKGLEEGSLQRMTEVIQEVLTNKKAGTPSLPVLCDRMEILISSSEPSAAHPSPRKSLAEIPPPSPSLHRTPLSCAPCSRNSATQVSASTPTATSSASNSAEP